MTQTCTLVKKQIYYFNGTMERYLTNFKGYSMTWAQAGKSSTSNSSQKTSIQKNKEYDIKKRSQKFVDSWKNEFPWATEVKRDGQNAIVCSICSEYSKVKANPSDLDRKNNSFLYGCGSFRKTSLESHAKSVQHVNFATRKKNELSGEPWRTPRRTLRQHIFRKDFNKRRLLNS